MSVTWFFPCQVEFRTLNVAANQNIDISGEAEQDSDGAERLSSITQQLSGKAKRLSGRAKHLSDSDNEVILSIKPCSKIVVL